MAQAEVWRRLHDLAANQFGLFTAAQARDHGVPRDELARRTAALKLFRAHHGVYGFTDDAADMHRFEDWAAQWLALRPEVDIDARRADPDCIISHDSAAVIRDLGTIVARGLYLSGPRRINPRSATVHAYRRDIGTLGIDWDVVEGLPVATAGRIIADLAREHLDGAHQGGVIVDALEAGQVTADEVAARLDPFARQWAEPDGLALARRFASAAGRELPRHLPVGR
jgi:predicted transcriptional regulator of viral defense system